MKFLKYFFILLFLIYTALYISQATGYYNYLDNKKILLTNEQIKEFEKDLEDGKPVDITDYISTDADNYGNAFTRVSTDVSGVLEKESKNFFITIFDLLGKLVN